MTLLANSLPENGGVSLSHLPMRHPETPETAAKSEAATEVAVEPDAESVTVDTPKPKRVEFNSPQAGSSQDELLEWLLNGASEEDGDGDHYENTDWYIKRILSNDSSISTNVLWNLAKDAGIKIGRATVGRLLKSMREGEYTEYITQRCHDLDINISNVLPGKNPKATFDGRGWRISDG